MMKINRRQWMIGAGAASLSSGIMRVKPMRAASVEMGWGVRLNGNSWLTHPGGIPGMSATGVCLIGYPWYSTTRPTAAVSQGLMRFGVPDSGVSHMCFVDHTWTTEPAIMFTITGQTGELTFQTWCNVGRYYDAGRWNTTLIAVDAPNRRAAIVINGVNQSLGGIISNPGDKYINFQMRTYIGSNGGSINSFVGDLADVDVFAGGSYIDPNDEDVLAGFFDTDTGYAVRKSSGGSGIVSGRTPQIHLSGPPQRYYENGGMWSWPGMRNNAGGDFTVVGTLQNSELPDPFEPGSPT